FLPIAQRAVHVLGVGVQYDGGDDIVRIGVVGQFGFDGVVGIILLGRDFHVAFRAAIAVLLFIVEHAAAQRQIGRILVGLGDGGEHADAARIRVLLELVVHQ